MNKEVGKKITLKALFGGTGKVAILDLDTSMGLTWTDSPAKEFEAKGWTVDYYTPEDFNTYEKCDTFWRETVAEYQIVMLSSHGDVTNGGHKMQMGAYWNYSDLERRYNIDETIPEAKNVTFIMKLPIRRSIYLIPLKKDGTLLPK